mmetsp:Transcript_14229/g.43053  ORF Transcript_14229/g.43053 Transcript_14229/m.43053 type:complete len:201 (-) Transcript_14229:3198-3800(-)
MYTENEMEGGLGGGGDVLERLRGSSGVGFGLEDAGVVVGHDADEVGQGGVPGVEDGLGPVGVGGGEVLLDVGLEFVLLGGRGDGSEADHAGVALVGEDGVGVVDVGDAAAHAGGEVAAGVAEDHEAAAGHVLCAVVAEALDDGEGSAVAHAEPLAGLAAEERLPARRAVQAAVPDDHVVRGREGRLRELVVVGADDDAAS